MKRDKQIVLDMIRGQDKSKLHFVDADYYDDPEEDQEILKEEIKQLKNLSSIDDKVLKIVELAGDYATFDTNNRFQCRAGAYRSAIDIWRIYNNYFRPVTLFLIMRTLYKLVIEESCVETSFCRDIHKQVFTCGGDYNDIFVINELGVRFAEWRTIGL